MRLKLKIQPIPNSTWGISLANKMPSKEWLDLTVKVYRDADYTCEICGATGVKLHCHEVWEFDDRKKIQRLVRLECCCELCHNVHHFGRSTVVYKPSYVEKLIKHWCKVNGKTKQDFIEYQKEIFEINKRRAKIFYIVKVGRMILA